MENLNFVAVDFETASSNKMACQIGFVVVEKGMITHRYSTLIHPPGNSYDWHTIRIHHISPEDTKHSDTFDLIWDDIMHYFIGSTIVAHNASFDESVLYANLDYYNISHDGIKPFICTCDLYGRMGLRELCQAFAIDYSNHHNALFDAECCAKFYLNYLNGIEPDFSQIKETPKETKSIYHETLRGDVLKKDLTNANPNNPFYNKKIVITGIFKQDRKELGEKLKSMGADIDTGITKRTNYVLIGGDPGPKKIEKIEKLLSEGVEIKKIYQTDLDCILQNYD